MLRKLHTWISRQYQYLLQIRDTPHAIAGGLAWGVFFGFIPILIPFVPAKTLLALLLAWLFRCSKLSAVIGVACHDILLPVWPLVLRWQYKFGYWLLAHPHQFPPKFPVKHFRLEQWLHWKTLKLLWPTFIGSLLMSIPLALLCYFISLRIVRRYQHRQATREPVTYS